MRRACLGLLVLALGEGALFGKSVTLPAVASFVGAAPFYSDVRVFNPSYSATVSVTATYRCFLGVGATCPATAPVTNFPLAPRESKAFNDMIAATFDTPNTAGGVEFDSSGAEDDIIVTSRLYSTFPTPTVGMFVPGLEDEAAHANTVLTSIRNGGSGQGFRTNVGMFRREATGVTVTWRIFVAGAQVGSAVQRTVGGHSGTQVNAIFTAAGVPAIQTDNAVIVVTATGAVFSYAAVIDNTTTDPIFVVGAEDQSFTPTTPIPTTTAGASTATPTRTPTRTATQVGPSPTRTPTLAGPTATRTPTAPGPTATFTPTLPGPTASFTPTRTPSNTPPPTFTRTPTNTPTPPPLTASVSVGQGGSRYTDSVSGTSTSTIAVGGTVTWTWFGGVSHSVTGGGFNSGIHTAPHSFQHTFNSQGSFPYQCSVHGSGMSGTVVVVSP